MDSNNKNPRKEKEKNEVTYVRLSYKRNKDFNKLKPAMKQGIVINT